MNQDDTLCDEIEDATEEDIPYELWVINKRVKTKMENIKQSIVMIRNSIDRTNDAEDIAEFETEFVYILESSWLGNITRTNRENKAAYGFHDTVAADPADDGLVSEIPQPNEPSTAETV